MRDVEQEPLCRFTFHPGRGAQGFLLQRTGYFRNTLYDDHSPYHIGQLPSIISRSDIARRLSPGASNRHRLAFLFHGRLRTRLSPWVSYTSSADLSSRKPCGTCEARWPRLTGTSVPERDVTVKWLGMGSRFPRALPQTRTRFSPRGWKPGVLRSV